ncbi:hypothetical protein [Streptomyces sp. NK15101]|uniref:hypothetical protein n=1 Tax=Streptomyces sp. NK15101 TaxID=2873261 RepID=UPI001CEDE1B5|nr:hypothetical protein [Streptomyces sp. NK15101]
MPTSEAPGLFSRLRVHSVVEPGDDADGGICIVRCVAGVARVGQVFVLERDQDTAEPEGALTLEDIDKYRRSLEFIDPPHSAAVLLSGGPLDRLREGDVLVSHPAPDWYRRLEACGLRVLDLDRSPVLPDARRAHFAWAGYEVRPAATVGHARPDAAAELDRRWDSFAKSARLCTDEGEFCMMAPGPGSHEIGWIRVKDLVGADLPSRLLAGAGLREFLAVSVDGRTMCAVSDEEYDQWIIVHRFDEERRGT